MKKQSFFNVKSFTLFLSFFLLTSCSDVNVSEKIDEVKVGVEKAQDEFESFKDDVYEAKDKAIKAKEDIEEKIEEVKEAAEKIEEASKSFSEAMDAVNKITDIAGDSSAESSAGSEEVDVMESVETAE